MTFLSIGATTRRRFSKKNWKPTGLKKLGFTFTSGKTRQGNGLWIVLLLDQIKGDVKGISVHLYS
jgi:hypothetical protein